MEEDVLIRLGRTVTRTRAKKATKGVIKTSHTPSLPGYENFTAVISQFAN